ncbi:putative methyltransferase-domain-containing protein [Cadophora sp. MPI-SDFR-AT-0126]|nr:putative methyltransferase-domain-containing protein [Leotiomycetes sp. MPI-SDFR-AT-0126]
MHYIRFLKAPRMTQDIRGLQSLTAVITITTDLGDAFLYSDLPLAIELEDAHGRKLQDGGKGKDYVWRASDGYKGLLVEVPIGIQTMRAGAQVKMVIKAKKEQFMAEDFDHVLGHKSRDSDDEGSVVTLRGLPDGNGIVERVFKFGDGQDVHVWEESGESIARHIWDAGLVLSAYLSNMLRDTPSSRSLPRLPTLRTILSNHDLNVLELGAGCGIVGISLCQALPNITQMILTDLPEATSILTHNISLCSPAPNHSVLDWSQPLPAPIASTQWNLILIADCTYNPDVVPDLVHTLGRLADGNKDLNVLLAMKVRHSSEAVFFTLMEEGGWVIRESIKLPLPVLGGEEEEIDIFVFGVDVDFD